MRHSLFSYLLFLVPALLMGRTDRAVLTGTVSDASGAAVAKAEVTVSSPGIGLTRRAATTAAGADTISGLPIGTYTASITAPGFARTDVEPFELQVGQTRTLDAKLAVTGVETKVEIRADAPLVQSSAAVGGVIAGEQIQNLPVNGRNWAGLMALVPGAIDSGVSDQKSVRFAGRATDDNNYRIDGVDATGIQNQGQRTSTRLQISTEAIAEFRATSALYTAETGGSAGGQVEVVSKTGSNAVHGSVFEFLRNNVFGVVPSFETSS